MLMWLLALFAVWTAWWVWRRGVDQKLDQQHRLAARKRLRRIGGRANRSKPEEADIE